MNLKQFKNIVCLAAVFSLLLPSVSMVFADGKNSPDFCDGFGKYATFSTELDGYKISDLSSAKIVDNGSKNKALCLSGEKTVSVVKSLSSNLSGKFVYQIEFWRKDSPISASIGVTNGTNKYELLKIRNNVITMSDGKTSKSLGTVLSVAVDNDAGLVSVYSGNECVIDKWNLTSKSSSYDGVYFTKQAESGDIYIDSLALYSGAKKAAKVSENTYSSQKDIDMYLDQYPNNFTFFDSNFINTAGKRYVDTSLSSKGEGNSVTAQKLDYQNVNKGNLIIFHKEADDSTYNEAIMNMGTTMRSDLYPETYYYRHYSIEGDFKVTPGIVGHLLFFRDTSVSPAAESSVMTYSGGNINYSGKGTVATVETDTWNHIEMYIDLDNHLINVFLNGKLIVSDFSFSETISNISVVRLSVYRGSGDLTIKDWRFKGLKEPMKKEVINGAVTPVVSRPSQFPDDSAVREYLSDKIVFHADGNIIYKDGAKISSVKKMKYDNQNGEVFVSAEDFKTALGVDITYDEETKEYSDGTNVYKNICGPAVKKCATLIPSCALAKAIGYNAAYLEYGKMVMVSRDDNLPENSDDNRSWFDKTFYSEGHAAYYLTEFTPVQEISNFIFYDRPTAKKIEEDFNKATAGGAMHPRIGITSQMIDSVNEMRNSDAEYNAKFENYLATVDANLDKEPPSYTFSDGLRTLNAASYFRNIAIPAAFCYQVTKDAKYARRAIDDLLTVSAFPDYNPGHVIDMGMWLKGMGIVYDWCYDAMTEEERNTAADAIIKKGIEIINKAYYAELSAAVCTFGDLGASYGSASFFPKWKSNFVAYTQGGVTIAALAVAERAPEVCFDTLEKTLRSWEYSNFGFYSGGAWVEGKTYQNVVNGGLADAMSAMVISTGTDYNILEYPGVEENLSVLINLNSAAASFTYADDNARDAWASIISSYNFFSSYYDDAKYGKWRNYALANKAGEWQDFVYYKPEYKTERLDGLDKVSYTLGGEFFTVHEDWNDKNALFFAAAGGPTRHYHFHNDGGDFLLCMDGVRWSYDLGQGNYNVGTNYTRYGGRTEAHNTLTINPDENYSQAEHSFAEITRYEEGAGGAYAVMDMTSLYAHHGADKVERGFYIGDNYDTVTIRDEMVFNKNANGYWFMTTEAAASKLDDETVILSKNGKTLVLQYKCEGDNAVSNISIMDAAPLPTSPKLENDATAVNPNLKKVAIYFEGSGEINITVRMAALPGDVDLTPISQWQAPEITELPNDDFGYDVIVDGVKTENPSKIYISDASDIKDFEIAAHDSTMQVEVDKTTEIDKPMRIIIRKPDTARFAISSVEYSVDYDLGLEKNYNILPVADYFVSATPESQNSGPNIFDKSFATRWTGYNKGDYLQADLGETKTLDAVALGFWKGAERKYSFDVLVSDDGDNFTKAASFTSDGSGEMYQIFSLGGAGGRYIRIVGQGNTANDVINILECRFLAGK